VKIKRHITNNGEQMQEACETAALLRTDLQEARETAALLRTELAQARLAWWEQWLANDEVWSSSRIWDWVLDAALSVGLADYANVQLVHPRLRGLELKAQRGFQRPFLEFFRFVSEDHSACGMALKRHCPIMVNDVATSSIFANTPQLEVVLDAGVRAVQSLPLIGCNGQMLGMLSVHYREPNAERSGTCADLQVLARTISLALERHSIGASGCSLPVFMKHSSRKPVALARALKPAALVR
jgi:hypothetical protein